jgi:drug/metabolite transporter (DMT)-like permease
LGVDAGTSQIMNALNTPAPARPLLAIGLTALTGLLFVGMTATVKHIGADVPPAQSAFLRFALGLVYVLPALPALRRMALGADDLKLFGLRGLVHTLGVLCWFYAMTAITLAEVTAMNYMIPVYVALGAALFLGEKLRMRRLLAIAVAVIGAMIVLRPGFRELSSGHLAMVGTAVFLAASYLIAKRLTGRAPASVVVAMLSIAVTIGLAPAAAMVWVPIGAREFAWLFATATFATAGHYTMTLAFAAAPISVSQPVTALQLVWAVTMGALIFGEPVDGFVVLGGAVIAASVIFIALREHQLRGSEWGR